MKQSRGYIKSRTLNWKHTAKMGYGDEYVSRKEADAVVNRLIEIADAMSLQMMTQMMRGLDEREFISSRQVYQDFVYGGCYQLDQQEKKISIKPLTDSLDTDKKS